MIRRDAISRAVRKMNADELKKLSESLDHALSKPDYELSKLIPKLIDGHHHISTAQAARIKAAVRGLTSAELEWLTENMDMLKPE